MNTEFIGPIHIDIVKNLYREIKDQKEDEYFHPHPFTSEYADEICNGFRKDIYVLYLDNDDSVIGYGMLRGWDEGFEIPSLGIFIPKSYRGKGYGRIFMSVLHEIASKYSEKVRLTVLKDNPNAISLYKSLGYVLEEKDEETLVGFLDLKS